MVTAASTYAGWIMTTIAGDGGEGYSGDGGPASRAKLNGPHDVVADAAGNLFVCDSYNNCIRRIDARSGIITTVAGTGQAGFSGDGGPATEAWLDHPYGVAVNRDGSFYIADRFNARVRQVDGRSRIITTLAGNGGKSSTGDGGPAAKSGMVEPNDMAFSVDGTRLYVADVTGQRVRVIDLRTDTIATFAGTGEARHDGDGGPAAQAGVYEPRAVAVGADDTVYIMERRGSCVRAVNPQTGIIRTAAGTGGQGNAGDGGTVLQAVFDKPKEMTFDRDGNLIVVDTENGTLRLIDWKADRVTTIAGNGKRGYAGDGGLAVEATMGRPHGVAVGSDGALYIGDTEGHCIRKMARPG